MTDATCWQYTIKRTLQRNGAGHAFRCKPSDAEIRRITQQEAGAFILKFEWLGNMGRSKYCYGLFIRDALVSVVCFGPLVSTTHFKTMLGRKWAQKTLQLCRGASSPRAPKWAPSKLIGASLRLLAQDTSAWGVVAYADPTAGEIGTIYQATNALYLGLTNPGGSRRYKIKGHWYDPRRVRDKFGSRASAHLRRIDPNFQSVPVHKKHRYFWVVGPPRRRTKLRERLARLCKPYPTRAAAPPCRPLSKRRLGNALRLAIGRNSQPQWHFAASRPAASQRLGYAREFRSSAPG